MSTAPVRFEEVAYNYGFIPVEPHTNRGYCLVYRLFKECMEEPGKIVLIRGNEWVIQMKDISGPLEEREKITIFSQDIIDYYPFNFKSKAVGFLIQARRRSKTGYCCRDTGGPFPLIAARDPTVVITPHRPDSTPDHDPKFALTGTVRALVSPDDDDDSDEALLSEELPELDEDFSDPSDDEAV
ncbi:unnamed protein product [Taenia asiatica]|uniref:DUF5737 domain-containing protein n=1 Tax=Taenia asiatica TaxID=60517 RepID=A0A0R3W224_TAEAS|nr:unnamed protein product [Taenia asiatica]